MIIDWHSRMKTEAHPLSQDTLNMLSGLLRRPFTELYLAHPGAALRLSAAIFTTIVHDRINQSWKTRDSQSRSNWEQIAVVLLAGVQVTLDIFLEAQRCLLLTTRITWKPIVMVGYFFDIEIRVHSSFPAERVKLIVAQAYYAIICNAFFSVSSPIPLSTYSVSLRVSVSTSAVICPRKLT
jgi:hypothetical protein